MWVSSHVEVKGMLRYGHANVPANYLSVVNIQRIFSCKSTKLVDFFIELLFFIPCRKWNKVGALA